MRMNRYLPISSADVRLRAVLVGVLTIFIFATMGMGVVAGETTGNDTVPVVEIEEGEADTETVATTNVTIETTGDAVEISGYELTLQYDPEVIVFSGIHSGEYTDPTVNDADAEDGTVTLVGVDGTGPQSPFAPAVTLEFEVIGEEGDESPITVDTDSSNVAGPGGEFYDDSVFHDGKVAVSGAADGDPFPGEPGDDDTQDDTENDSDTAGTDDAGDETVAEDDTDNGDDGSDDETRADDAADDTETTDRTDDESDTDDQDDESDTEEGDDGDADDDQAVDESTDDATPGFGIVAVVVAGGLLAFFVTRQRAEL